MIVFAGHFSPVELFLKGRGFRLIYGITVMGKPVADLFQHFFLKVDHFSVAFRADVEQVVSSSGNYINQTACLFPYFVFHVAACLPGAISPCLVEHGSGALPGSMKCFLRVVIVGHHTEIVLVVSQSPADHAIGLVPVNHFVKFFALCGRIGTHVNHSSEMVP